MARMIMARRLDTAFWLGSLIWAFFLGLCLPYLTLLFHFAFVLSDWTPFDVDAETGIWISRSIPIGLTGIFLFFMVRSALRLSSGTVSKSHFGLIALVSGIIGIGLGIFTAVRLGLFLTTPSFV